MHAVIEITIVDHQYIVTLPKMVLVMSKEQFVECLRAGKRYKRQQAMAKRMEAVPERPHQRRGSDVHREGFTAAG
jgi:hypothetical protein